MTNTRFPFNFLPAGVLVFVLGTIGAAILTGCAVSAPPIENMPRVAMPIVKDAVTVSASPNTPVGSVVPVDISITNGTTEPRLLVPSQIFAINEHDQRIIPIAPNEAIRDAGNANALKAGLTGAAKNAAIGAIAGAIIGGAMGVALGAVVGQPAQGLALGAAVGGGLGGAEAAVAGGVQGQVAAHQDAATQISDLALPAGEVHPDFSVNGYVFFPQGNYKAVQVLLLNEETHQTDTIQAVWGGAHGELREEEDTSPSDVSQSAPAGNQTAIRTGNSPQPSPRQ